MNKNTNNKDEIWKEMDAMVNSPEFLAKSNALGNLYMKVVNGELTYCEAYPEICAKRISN